MPSQSPGEQGCQCPGGRGGGMPREGLGGHTPRAFWGLSSTEPPILGAAFHPHLGRAPPAHGGRSQVCPEGSAGLATQAWAACFRGWGRSVRSPAPNSLLRRSSDSTSFDLRVLASWCSAPTSWDADCVEAVEDKLSLCVPGELCGLSSQLLCWVCRNMLCFAKYELLKFRRNAGAASQASALYQKWTVRWTVRGRPVGRTHLCADGYHMDTRRVLKAHPNLDGLG